MPHRDPGTIRPKGSARPELTRQVRERAEKERKAKEAKTAKKERDVRDKQTRFREWLQKGGVATEDYASLTAQQRQYVYERFVVGSSASEAIRQAKADSSIKPLAWSRDRGREFAVVNRGFPTAPAKPAKPVPQPAGPPPSEEFVPGPRARPGDIAGPFPGEVDANLETFREAIKKKESGGNYRAIGQPTRYGTATGAYQFLDSTWGNYKGYRRAADAPPHIQDERARQVMSEYFRQFQNWPLVAVAWYAGPGAARRLVKEGQSPSEFFTRAQSAGGKQFPSILAYAESVMGLMGQVPGAGLASIGVDIDPSSAEEFGVATTGRPFRSQEDFEKWVRDQAKQRWPAAASQIDQGFTVRQIFDQYAQDAIATLGISEGQVDMMDPKWSRAIDYSDPQTGNKRMMDRWEWVQLLKTNDVYGYNFTPKAKDEAAEIVLNLQSMLGVRG